MSAETCTRSQCPEMPKVTLDQAVIDLMESIALQETALSHIPVSYTHLTLPTRDQV